jgi:hypothetical protein
VANGRTDGVDRWVVQMAGHGAGRERGEWVDEWVSSEGDDDM